MTTTDATSCTVCGGPFSNRRIHIEGKPYHLRCSYESSPSHTNEDAARLTTEIERLRKMLDTALYSMNTGDYEEQKAVSASIKAEIASPAVTAAQG